MNSFYQMGDEVVDKTLVVNIASPALNHLKESDEASQKLIVLQIYYVALLAYTQLNPDELEEFSRNQTQLIKKYLHSEEK